MPELRALGKTGLQVAPICFGGNVFGWTADEATSFALLDALVDNGFSFIDTADVYSRWADGHQGGESERIIGKWLRQGGGSRREQVVLATKVGMDMGDGKNGLRPDYIRAAVDASLQRLQTDYIDLYYAHQDDVDTPLDETLGAFDALVKAGKVRHIGASNYSAPRLEQALQTSARLGLARYDVLQPLYNLYDRADFEQNLLPLVQEHELAVAPYFSLAAGFLTGKYRKPEDAGKSPRGKGVVEKYLNDRGLVILNKLDETAERYHATPSQVALSWLIRQPGVTAAIASVSSLDQLDELLFAARLRLDVDALEELSLASSG
ncbi:aldo/keto reductase [Corticibacter populi]|uniref:Aldo/keto reductase n=1 Tax=Corticibacter populi TaxID=1550736 RepID=A0A3M6QZD2_9BURK|nr:aldo/keto reductase [Corticibacter populi]RMX08273.1 aldo/keto reductase [Corticibacter populi]RZS35551.1 aryl-alcohol dehydrogenase-like predicted oxidoreductase [Corticibacter populi]